MNKLITKLYIQGFLFQKFKADLTNVLRIVLHALVKLVSYNQIDVGGATLCLNHEESLLQFCRSNSL